jgi:transposase
LIQCAANLVLQGGEQQRKLRQFAGSCRFVFNKALALQQANREAGEKFIGYVPMAKHLTTWRNGAETPWLKDAPVHPLQHALKDLDRAYSNFFAKRADFPRFKKKDMGDSFRYPDPKQIKLDQGNARLFLPKLGWLHYRNSRQVLGTVKNVTVSLSSGRWFVSIQTEREVQTPLHASPLAVGIDLGIVRSKSHALLCVEDLQVSNMSRSAKGDAETPGKNIRQKSGLNRSILDQGWGEFRRQLDYKSAWAGGWLVAVAPQNTSRQCPVCGHIDKDNRQPRSLFLCTACGHSENADRVAARNIRERGLNLLKGPDMTRIACEVNGAVMPSATGTHRSDDAAQAA